MIRALALTAAIALSGGAASAAAPNAVCYYNGESQLARVVGGDAGQVGILWSDGIRSEFTVNGQVARDPRGGTWAVEGNLGDGLRFQNVQNNNVIYCE